MKVRSVSLSLLVTAEIRAGEFVDGEMTGVGIYSLQDGGLYDSSTGVYYPNAENKAEFHEAHFDGKILRYKKADPSAQRKVDYKK